MSDNVKPLFIQNLIGHQDSWEILSNAWSSGRFAHAWLITGPRGIGKASFAYTAAKAILTVGSLHKDRGLFSDVGPDGLSRDIVSESPIVCRIENGAHPDFLSIEIGWADDKQTKRRTEIVIEDVRSVSSFLSMTPAEGGWRVIIVDAVDEMNRNAANALLKSLEEPPKNTVLFLIAHNQGRLLPTIKSRCRRLPLMPLTSSEMVEGVTRYLPEVTTERRNALIAIAQGSLGEALALARMDGDYMASEISELLKYWPKLNIPHISDFANKIAADPERFRLFSVLLGDWLSKVMRRGVGVDAAGHDNTFVQAVPLEQWFEVWEKINQLFRKTDAVNLDRRQVVFSVFYAIISPATA